MSDLVACCDDRHSSPFCPMCGKRLKQPSPIDALLCHLAKELKKKRGFVRTKRIAAEEPNANKLKLSNEIQRIEKTIATWESWREAIHELRAKANK